MFCVIQQIAHFCITNSLTETQSIYLQGQTKFNQPSSAEIGIFRDTYINTMAADAPAPYVTRPSATMILTLLDKPTLGFHEEISQIIAPSHCRQFIKMKMLLYFFLRKIQRTKGYPLKTTYMYSRWLVPLILNLRADRLRCRNVM